MWLTIIILLFIILLLYTLYTIYTLKTLKTYNFDSIKKYIPLEEFTFTPKKLTTEDGYIIQLVNLRHKTNFKENLKPVIIQHGLGASCATWLVGGKEYSPAMILASKG